MNDKAKAARQAYNRAYYQRNREKIRQQQAKYWERKASEMESAEKVNRNDNE